MVSKEKIKNYLASENKTLAKEMHEKMDDPSKWDDFKSDLASLVSNYSKEPTQKNKSKLEKLISDNFVNNSIVGQDALDTIIKDFGIKEKREEVDRKTRIKEDAEAYRRAIFQDLLGIEYAGDIRKRREKEIQEKHDAKYGINRYSKSPKSKKSAKEIDKDKKKKKNKDKKQSKKDGKIKSALKKLYFKLTAEMLRAPGEVPPQILAENREILKNAEVKLDQLIQDLKMAHKICSYNNKSKLNELPDDIKTIYAEMSNGEIDEEFLSNFKITLQEEQTEQFNSIRKNLEKMQSSKLESSLRQLAKDGFPDMPEEELQEELEYVMLDSNVDEERKLVLPERSIFKELLFDKNGELKTEQVELAELLATYSQFPKVSELSDEEIMNFFQNSSNPSKMDLESKEYALAQMFEKHDEIEPDDIDTIIQEMQQASDKYELLGDVILEVELAHKLMLSKKLKEQFQEIDKIVSEYDEKEVSDGVLDKDDKMKRQLALKIARKKVSSLEKAGLSRVVTEGEKKSKSFIKRAKSVLLTNLQDARDAGEKKFEKTFAEQDDDKEP